MPAAAPNPLNAYSPEWFQFFHEGIPEVRTAQEAGFISALCPVADFPRILDVCCGMGRHSRALASLGYAVTGIERDPAAVAAAVRQSGGPVYREMDIRDWRPEPESFDAAVILSQSFGFFGAEANLEILTRLAAALRPGGRIVLDLWNPAFFLTRQGRRDFVLPGGMVVETKQMTGDRLTVRLDYPGGGSDLFEWQTFTEIQMADFAGKAGLGVMPALTDYDPAATPSPDRPKIQFVLERG
ncbi:MAG: class I SAM-dependent methyltransferase [Verrucomicrobiota bacterium]